VPWVIRDAPFDWTLAEAGRRRQAAEVTLNRVTGRLTEANIDYAVIGGMALIAHGYVRYTDDVDILTSREGLEQVHAHLVGRGFVPAFPGARKTLRDTTNGVRVEFITTGEYPGDGKPKPVAFPNPRGVVVDRDGKLVIALPKLIELKLASGLSAAHRLRDLSDVQDLIVALELPRDFGELLDESVRGEYLRMWDAAANATGPDRE
jgi:hypothetical protein